MLFKSLTITVVILLCSCDNKKVDFKAGRKVFYNDDGIGISQIIDFNDYAQQEGYYISFDTTGSIQRIQKYTVGIPNGERLIFYSNGNLKSKTLFLNGKKNGVEYNFYENGLLESEIVWKGDTFTGSMREYDEKGIQIFIHCKETEMYNYSELIKYNKTHGLHSVQIDSKENFTRDTRKK